jgi:hypothetical protein
MDLVTQIPGVLVLLPRKTMDLVTQIHLGQALHQETTAVWDIQILGALVHPPRKTMVLVTQILMAQAQVILDFALISIAIKEDVKDSKQFSILKIETKI